MKGLHYPFRSKINPAGLTFVAAIHVGVAAVVAMMPGGVVQRIIQPDLKLIELPKLAEQPKTVEKTPPPDRPLKLELPKDLRVVDTSKLIAIDKVEPLFPTTGPGRDPIVPEQTEAAQPLMIEAKVDPRFTGAMQPPYPPSMQRLGAEGFVSVRVLIGVDGRVKDASIAESSGQVAFEQAALQQALRKWRFMPATRDGVQVESWRTLTVRFRMVD